MLCGVQVCCIQCLDNAPCIHHHDPVAKLRHQMQIMTDEDQAHAAGIYQPIKKCQYLKLNGHVQR